MEKSPDLPIIALSHTMWHPGIIGITASQLVSEFQKPVVLISETETVGRGSARTIGGVSIFELLSHCEEYFLNFGGHHDAAGFSIDLAKIPDFLARIGEVATEQIDRDTLYSTHKIDAVISVKDIHLDFIDELEILAPFGQGNPEPLFFCKDFTVLDARRIGADGNHLKATLSSLDHEHCVDAIGFKMGDQVSDLMGKHCEIICHIRANEWQGRRMAQANIVEIKVA